MRAALWLPPMMLFACGSALDGNGPERAPVDCDHLPEPSMSCAYPSGAMETMRINEVLFPYRWPEAINGAGENRPLAMEQVFCNGDPNVDWSRAGYLLFISL